jgi:hypothetical protein
MRRWFLIAATLSQVARRSAASCEGFCELLTSIELIPFGLDALLSLTLTEISRCFNGAQHVGDVAAIGALLGLLPAESSLWF